MGFNSCSNDKWAAGTDCGVARRSGSAARDGGDDACRPGCDSGIERGLYLLTSPSVASDGPSAVAMQVEKPECMDRSRVYSVLGRVAPRGPASNSGWRRWFCQGLATPVGTSSSRSLPVLRLCGGGGGGVSADPSSVTSSTAAPPPGQPFSSISQAGGGWNSPSKLPPVPPAPGVGGVMADNPPPAMNGSASALCLPESGGSGQAAGSANFPAGSNSLDDNINSASSGGNNDSGSVGGAVSDGAAEDGARAVPRETITNGVALHHDVPAESAASSTGAAGALVAPSAVGTTPSAADTAELEVARLMQQAITATEGWGATQVNQDTSWNVPPSPEPLAGAGAGPVDPTMAAAMMGRMTGVLAQWKQPGVSNGTEVWHANLRNGGVPMPRPPDPQWTPHVPQKNVGGTWGEDDDALSNDNMWGGAGAGQRGVHGGASTLHRPPSVMSGSGSWAPSMLGKQGDLSVQQQAPPSSSGGMMLPHHAHHHHPHQQQHQPPPILPSVQQPPPLHPHSHMLPHSQHALHGVHQLTGGKAAVDHMHRPSLDTWGGVRSGSGMSGPWAPGAAGSGSTGPMSVGAGGAGANCWPPPAVDDRLQQNAGGVPLGYDDWNKRQGVMSRGSTNHMLPGSGGANSRLSGVPSGSGGADGWPRTGGPGVMGRGWPSAGDDAKLRQSSAWPTDIGNDTDWSKMGRSMPHKNHLVDRNNLRGVQQESIELLMRSNPMMSIDEAIEQLRASGVDQHAFSQQLQHPLQQQQLPPHHPLHQQQGQYMEAGQRQFGGPSGSAGASAAFSQMPPPPPTGPSQMGVGNPSMVQDVFRQQQQQSRAPTSSSYRFGGQLQQQQQQPQQQPMAQQLRPLIGQIQAAVQSGHLNPAVLQQPLAPPTLHLLNQLLAQVKLLDELTRRQQHVVRSGQPNPNQLQQLHMDIMRVKSNMSHIQNEISVQQSSLMKQQQAVGSGSGGRSVLPGSSARGDSLAGHQDLQHQQQQPGLTSLNFADMSISRDQPRLPASSSAGASSYQKSKLLSQWVLPTAGGGENTDDGLDKDLDFVRGGVGACSDLSTALTSSLLLVSSSDWSVSSSSAAVATAPSAGGSGGVDTWSTSAGVSGGQMNGSAVATNSLADLVPEFEPGKPWKGPQVRTADDDPTLTPGSLSAGISELLMITSASAVSTPASSVMAQGAASSALSASGDGWSYSSKQPGAGNYKWSGSGGAGDWSSSSPLSAIGAPRHTGAWSTGQQQGWSVPPGSSATPTDHTWLLLRNINTQIDSGTLSTLCMQHGPLVAFHMMSSRGLALARYSSSDQANRAQCALNQCTLAGSTIVCSTLSDEQAASITQQQQQPVGGTSSSLFSGVKAPSAAAWADVSDSSLGGCGALGWSSGGGSSLLWGSVAGGGGVESSSSVLDDVHQRSAGVSVTSAPSIGAIGAPSGCLMRSISSAFDSPQSLSDASRP